MDRRLPNPRVLRPFYPNYGHDRPPDGLRHNDPLAALAANRNLAHGNVELRPPSASASRVDYLASIFARIDVRDPLATAQHVLDRFGSIANFASADGAQLASAIGAIPALPAALAIAQEIAFAGIHERVTTSQLDPCNPGFLDYLRLNLGGRRAEILIGFFGTEDGRLLCERTLAESEGHALAISAAAVLRAAIAVGAARVVLVHNHPSGLARPSRADEIATKKLSERAAALDIVLLDHLIVGGAQVYSMHRRQVL